MACTFTIKKDVKSGMTPVHLKVRARVPAVDVRQDLPFEVDAFKWKNAHSSPSALVNFRKTEYGKQVYGVLDVISDEIEALLSKKVAVTSTQVRQIASDVIFAAQCQRDKEEAEARAAAEAEAKHITLNKFIRQYISDVESGARQTDKGTKYAVSTVKAIKQSMVQFEEFQKAKRFR